MLLHAIRGAGGVQTVLAHGLEELVIDAMTPEPSGGTAAVPCPAGPHRRPRRAEARGHVREVIRDWKIPVDPDIAVLLASDLVTNAIMTGTSRMVALAVRCSSGRLRIDVYDRVA